MATVTNHFHHNNQDIYTVDLHGTEIIVTVTNAASVVRRWLNAAHYFRRHYIYTNRLVVGLGVQWTAGGSDPPAATMQLCIGRRCLIFQIGQAETVPQYLRKFLLNPNHTFVGFWNHSDRRKLKSSEHSIEMFKDPLDLRRYVETDDGDELVAASVEEIVDECLGFEVVQRQEIGLSDWEDIDLSEDQVVYACVDAYCAFLIGKNIGAWKY